MTLLRLKALIYRYTGLYLAGREEAAYLNNNAVKARIKRLKKFGPNSAKGIVLGSWQAKHGFTGVWFMLPIRLAALRYSDSKQLRTLVKVVEHLGSSLLTLKLDVTNILRKRN